MANLAAIFGLGWAELLIILVVVLLLFGPKQLPKLGRMLGQGVRDFRDATKRLDSDEEDEEAAKSSAKPKEVPTDAPRAKQPTGNSSPVSRDDEH
jgi:sec-independent protein translocase protein TatA